MLRSASAPSIHEPLRPVALAVLLLALAASAGALLLTPRAATAQGMHAGGPKPRPLHVRMGEASVVAAVEILRVDPGRIGVRLQTPVLGSPPAEFEVKRAPSRPPPLAAGERAVLVLRGDRPPYVLVDEPHETIRIVDDEMGERWTTAVTDVAARLDAPAELAALYARWLDEGPSTLRELAGRGLGDEALDVPEAHERLGADRARAAFDPELPPDVRQLSAVLAANSASGAAGLLEGIRKEQPTGILGVALRAGAAHATPGTEALFYELLASEDIRVRAETIRAAGPMSKLIGLEAVLEVTARIAAEDEHPEIRRVAQRVNGQIQRNDPHAMN